MNLKLLILTFFTNSAIFAQEVSPNIGLDTTSIDKNQLYKLWANYLKSNPDSIYDNPHWSQADKLKYKSYDLLKSEGFLSPSLYYFQLNNKVLSITSEDNYYIIKSAFYDPGSFDIYAITNTVASEQNGVFKLSNYQPILTKNWKVKTVGNITYHYFPTYNLNEDKAIAANEYLLKICRAFDLKPEPIIYFIAQDCQEIFKVKGFDYVLSMGNSKECGFFDTYNNIIYATALAGENHQHELTHFVNKFFPNANELLLTGLSAYWGEDNAHKGKPLIYSIKRVSDYLNNHPEIDLNYPNEFWELDEETNPQYVIGALICDRAIELGGIPLLKKFLNQSKTNIEFLNFIENNLKIKKGNLNQYLRAKMEKMSKASN